MQFPALPAIPHPLQFKSVTFTALKPGPKLIVLGAVHGNEVSGSKAILKMIQEFEAGERVLVKGQVTFVPITNPLAYNRKQRNGDRNLNRNLTPTDSPVVASRRCMIWFYSPHPRPSPKGRGVRRTCVKCRG